MCTRVGARRRGCGVAAAVALGLIWDPHSAAHVELEAHAHLESARSLQRQRDHAGAVEEYARAISLIERSATPYSEDLVIPMAELAEAQAANGRPHEAIESLQRAVAIVRRSAGLYDERQLELLLRLVDLHSSVGEIDGARDALQYLRRLSATQQDTVARSAALTRIATWFCRIGRFEDGRRTYRAAIDAVSARAHPEAHLEALLVAPECSLFELAREGVATTPGLFERYRGPIERSGRMAAHSPGFRLHSIRVLRAESEQALVRATRIAAGLDDENFLVKLLLRAGDWFQMKDHTRAARRYYARAEALARKAGPDHALSAPVMVFYPQPPSALRRRMSAGEQAVERYVEVEFTVRANGRIDRERVIDRDAGKSAVDETLSALRAARFRPRMLNGEALETRGVRYRQRFGAAP